MGRKATAIEGDVALPQTAEDFVRGSVVALGGIDVFVNNAGICPFHAFLNMPVATFECTMQAAAVAMYRAGCRTSGPPITLREHFTTLATLTYEGLQRPRITALCRTLSTVTAI